MFLNCFVLQEKKKEKEKKKKRKKILIYAMIAFEGGFFGTVTQ